MDAMTPDNLPLDERQCLRLLTTASVGRVVYTVGALPAVLPTRYRIGTDGSVLLSSAAGSELARAVAGAIVAFETGEIDDGDGDGWTVTVLGRAEVSAEPGRFEPAGPAGLEPAGPGPQVTIRIRPELVTGRALPARRAHLA